MSINMRLRGFTSSNDHLSTLPPLTQSTEASSSTIRHLAELQPPSFIRSRGSSSSSTIREVSGIPYFDQTPSQKLRHLFIYIPMPTIRRWRDLTPSIEADQGIRDSHLVGTLISSLHYLDQLQIQPLIKSLLITDLLSFFLVFTVNPDKMSLGDALAQVKEVVSADPGNSTLSSANGLFAYVFAGKLLVQARLFSSTGLPSHIVLEMPALSPTMNQGNIAKWRKKEGDKINVGDVLCEIETDKATLEFESLEEGFLAKILAPEGSKDVLVGRPIAVTVEDPDEINNIPDDSFSGLEPKDEKPTDTLANSAELKVGTSKASFIRISPAAKFLIAQHRLEASSLEASGPRGTLLKGDVLAAIRSRNQSVGALKEVQDPIAPLTSTSKLTSLSSPESEGPLDGTVIHTDLQNSQIRKVIAKRLLESKQSIPHLYLSSDVILDPLLAFRKELKEQYNVKVSVNDIVLKAVALALKTVPEANVYWNAEKGESVSCDSVDISVAVATEKGLMTPIVRNADQKSLSVISLEVKELADKARAGKLKPDQFQGGSFSISNLGMYPVDHFCAIINPPQACILAVGRGNMVVEPVIGTDGVEKPEIVTKMSLKLSADHRVFDGQLASKFLSALSSNFSNIRRLLL
ncbi:hypothetical protein ZIOFF_049193 [Zingiber officinale]|uniref:Dihydrolipoamide acetyltransferase component of pyruvate dehydrogenase complex n=1 Tax=Zingiber officinale TaxID=94328 RepID=A0A8J5FTS2_ZINOF|nr:hypothetical protein ZIOFF_049193 [Zingiber officinale]